MTALILAIGIVTLVLVYVLRKKISVMLFLGALSVWALLFGYFSYHLWNIMQTANIAISIPLILIICFGPIFALLVAWKESTAPEA